MKVQALFALVAALCLPSSLSAQDYSTLGPSKCEWKCFCGDAGCGCNKGTPGTGGKSCSADDGCFVTACDAAALVLFEAADGDFAAVSHSPMSSATDAFPPPKEWEVDAAGRSVLRTCEDVIIARSFDPSLAERIRTISREIVI